MSDVRMDVYKNNTHTHRENQVLIKTHNLVKHPLQAISNNNKSKNKNNKREAKA